MTYASAIHGPYLYDVHTADPNGETDSAHDILRLWTNPLIIVISYAFPRTMLGPHLRIVFLSSGISRPWTAEMCVSLTFSAFDLP